MANEETVSNIFEGLKTKRIMGMKARVENANKSKYALQLIPQSFFACTGFIDD